MISAFQKCPKFENRTYFGTTLYQNGPPYKTANYLDGVTGITVDDGLFEYFYLWKSGICTKIEHNGQYQNISDNPKWHKTVPTCNTPTYL